VCSILKRGGFVDQLGAENIFVTKLDAIHSIFGRLDKSICERCDKRIFMECQQIEYKGDEPLAAGTRAASN